MSVQVTEASIGRQPPRALQGARDTLPFLPGVLILGIVFGSSGAAVGIGAGLAVAMSATVFSGAGQLAALPLWQQGALAVVLSTLALSMRFLLVAASVAPALTRLSAWQRSVVAFFLTDENYALCVSRLNGLFEPRYLLGSGVALYAAWLVGTIVGASVGNNVPDVLAEPAQTIFPLAFLIMVVLCCRTREMALVAVLGGALSLAGALLLPGAWHILLAGLLASLAGPLLERKRAT